MRECKHQWGCWGRPRWPGFQQTDTYNPSKGQFVYERECDIMGCSAVQRANRLEPVDPVEMEVD